MSDKTIKEQVIDELYKPARINYSRRHVIQVGIKDTFQIDLVDMQQFSAENENFRYILMCIDIFSKYLYARPLKTKTAREVCDAMRSIFDESDGAPNNIHSDEGKEFFNSTFRRLMIEYNINHYNTYSHLKASIVERVNRTIKTILAKLFDYNSSYDWVTILPDVVEKYNNTYHRTIEMTPADVNERNEAVILEYIYGETNKFVYKKPKFNIGDAVRVSKMKKIFEKGYAASWGVDIYEVEIVKRTTPRTYILRDNFTKELVKGAFYEQELQHVKYKDIYLVHRILRRRGNRVFVSWKGYGNDANSWINTSDIM